MGFEARACFLDTACTGHCRFGDRHHRDTVLDVPLHEEFTEAGHLGEQWSSPGHCLPARAVCTSPGQWVSL